MRQPILRGLNAIEHLAESGSVFGDPLVMLPRGGPSRAHLITGNAVTGDSEEQYRSKKFVKNVAAISRLTSSKTIGRVYWTLVA